MKNKILFHMFLVLIFILVLFIQVFVISGNTLFGMKPNVLLISVIVFTTFLGLYKGSIYSLILGVFCDFLYGSSFGVFTISYTLVAIIIGIISNNYRTDSSKLALIIMTFIGTAIFEISQFIIYSFLNNGIYNIFHLILQIFLASILNIVIVFILNGIISKVAEHLEIKSKEREALY